MAKQKKLEEAASQYTPKSLWSWLSVTKVFVVASALAAGVAGFINSLDTVSDFLEKHTGWSSFRAREPMLPIVLSQSEEDCVRPDHTCQVELWIQNPYDKPVYITALSLSVLSVETEPILGMVEASATYPVDLTGLSQVGMTRKVELYQQIEPQKSDRFVLLLGARDLHDRFRRWQFAAEIETREGKLGLKPLKIQLPWDVEYSAGPPTALPSPAQ